MQAIIVILALLCFLAFAGWAIKALSPWLHPLVVIIATIIIVGIVAVKILIPMLGVHL